MTNKLQLPTVTLICCDCVDARRAVNVLEHCKNLCDFGAVKLLTSIPVQYPHRVKIMPLNSLVAYSIFMLTNIYQYIETEHVLIVQRDGWILNPQSFKQEWLSLDWISPLFVQYDRCGSGGFSLRSKRLMEEVTRQMPEWDGTQKGADEIQASLQYYEDGEICLTDKFKDFKFATLDQAADFAMGGNRNPAYYRKKAFGYHGTWSNIDHSTGDISPVCNHPLLDCECNKDHVDYLQKMAEDLVK